jgi:phosphoribosylanthranilate isomerase
MISKNILIKVCGMRDAENIREVEQLSKELSIINSQLSIDLMGFIFWPKSSRYVSERPAYLPAKCKRVGVFVDENPETIKKIAEDYALDIIQLHGTESPDFVRRLRSVYGDSVAVIKAFNIATKEDLDATKPYEGLVDYFLFDTRATMPAGSPAGSVLPGGTGAQFDWSVLADYVGETPFLLSGGIGPDDADRVRAFHHPKCIGIDLNSKFEVSPALKDVEKLKRFLENVKM